MSAESEARNDSMLASSGRRRGRHLAPLLSALVLCLVPVSLMTGTTTLSPSELWEGLHHHGVAGIILYEIRLPRVILSGAVGAMLGLSGAALQGLLRNPLAEPAIFGAPQAAALGAVAVLYSGLSNALSFALPLAAIAGALLSILLVFLIAGARAPSRDDDPLGTCGCEPGGSRDVLVINCRPIRSP